MKKTGGRTIDLKTHTEKPGRLAGTNFANSGQWVVVKLVDTQELDTGRITAGWDKSGIKDVKGLPYLTYNRKIAIENIIGSVTKSADIVTENVVLSPGESVYGLITNNQPGEEKEINESINKMYSKEAEDIDRFVRAYKKNKA